ncbi:MAG: ubiA [Rhodospirillales bacterium]|nr:ubiA [Rhodospirillales bacterium]
MATPVHTDLHRGNWVDRWLPAAARPYARLARWDRPIGIWLLLLPCWWGLALAGPAYEKVADPKTWISFLVGAIAMRGAGCTLNDLLDRDIDAKVERTRGRPLPAGEVTPRQAVIWLAAQTVVGVAVLLQFQPRAIALGAASLLVVAIYPLMKRVMDWPQLVLGFAFNWGALLGWTVATDTIGGPSWWLYAAGICWTLIYDTIYAHQDRRDDAIIGVRSTARTFGRHSKLVLTVLAFAMVVCLHKAIEEAQLGPYAAVAKFFVLGHLSMLLARWQPNDPANCLATFKASRWTGVITLGALAAGQIR